LGQGVVEDDRGSLLQRVAGVANAMQALKAVGFNLVLVQPDEVVVRRREDRRRWWRHGWKEK
jgi:hypothetical protein